MEAFFSTQKSNGRKSMETFVSSQIQRNKNNFWDPIQRLKIKTFSSMAKKFAVSKQKDKTVTVNADRKLFGRLLVAARNRDIDLKEVLSYELCGVPVALVHPDGSLRKTTKSTLMYVLENNVTCRSSLPSSQHPTACLIDAMALVQIVKSARSATFSQLSQKYQDIVTSKFHQNSHTRVDLIFDQYRPVSIKAQGNAAREENQARLKSTSTVDPRQNRSSGQNKSQTQRTNKT